jgi:heme-degrading monooxygenase HmoA
MFVRVGTFRIQPGTLDALRQRYYAECAPLVKATKGNVDCVVLEPVDEDEQAPVAVCTVWQTEADAAAYEASGTAVEVVGRMQEFFRGPPDLYAYRIQRP